jgi:hypothetical protein
MVRLLPILFPGPKSHLEKQSSQLFTLQQTASARGVSGISCWSKTFLWRSELDKDTRLTIISILDVSQEAMKAASKARTLTLQIHEALVQARVPGYLEAYQARCENLFSQLTDVKSKLAHVVDAGIQAPGGIVPVNFLNGLF